MRQPGGGEAEGHCPLRSTRSGCRSATALVGCRRWYQDETPALRRRSSWPIRPPRAAQGRKTARCSIIDAWSRQRTTARRSPKAARRSTAGWRDSRRSGTAQPPRRQMLANAHRTGGGIPVPLVNQDGRAGRRSGLEQGRRKYRRRRERESIRSMDDSSRCWKEGGATNARHGARHECGISTARSRRGAIAGRTG